MCLLKYFNIRLYETLILQPSLTEPCGFFLFYVEVLLLGVYSFSLHRKHCLSIKDAKHLSFMLKLGFENLETSHFKLNINYAVCYILVKI